MEPDIAVLAIAADVDCDSDDDEGDDRCHLERRQDVLCEYHGLVNQLRVNLLKERANVPISPYEWTLVALMSKRKTRKTSEIIQVC